MAGGPVQVVLNRDRFRDDRVSRRGGGGGKDFFRGDDDGFAAHRAALVHVLRSILRSNQGSSRINVTVQMRPDALAKSHRPFGTLFTSSRASHVGTARYGELIFAVSTERLAEIIAAVERAEITVMWRASATGKSLYAPSGARSETSAIESIRQWIPADERGFDLRQAEDWISSDNSTKLNIEMFDLPRGRVLRAIAIAELHALDRLAASHHDWFSLSGQALEGVVLPPSLNLPSDARQVRQGEPRTLDTAVLRQTLAAFESSSVVKRVRLEDRISADVEVTATLDTFESESSPNHVASLPVVGVIDGGIAGPFANSSQWVAGRTQLLATEHRGLAQVSHGTGIASLIALGSGLNPNVLIAEEDCRIYDLDLFPANEYRDVYYSSLDDYLDEVRASVSRAKESAGVRIFNLSYNLRRAPGGAPYSLAAHGLDRIAIDLDVIFVISAGNLSAAEERGEWPPRGVEAIAMLAHSTVDDGLGAPAESISNIGIGAVNPVGMALGIPGAPTRYTRRGTQVPSASKPDFAAPGGGSPASGADTSGLRAVDSFGNVVAVRGTSYASPIVARYLATLDTAIAGEVPRDLLIAIATHHAQMPDILRAREVAGIASSFVGHGVLPSVAETLDGAPHRITIVLSDTILPGRRVVFPFRWPESLTSPEGKCRGLIRLTLASQPVLNPAHGWEMVRINLDGAIKQADIDGQFEGKVQPTHQFFSGYRYATERTLASVLGKWYPVKSYERRIPNGIGESSDWELDIDYLTRAAEGIPASGVQFAAVLTIEDLAGEAPVFDEMRASLTTIGVVLNDLRTAINVGVTT